MRLLGARTDRELSLIKISMIIDALPEFLHSSIHSSGVLHDRASSDGEVMSVNESISSEIHRGVFDISGMEMDHSRIISILLSYRM
jgi:hypothetical protein